MSPDLPEQLVVALRREVGLFRRSEHRRRFPLGVHAGRLGGPRSSAEVPWPVPDHYDAGLRLDLLDALLSRESDDTPTAIWLTRPGDVEQHDVDLRWRASAMHACAARGVTLTGFYVVTRVGWRDTETGASRTWRRLRL